ncbi:trypsin-like serine peptidase [Streptomyces sp. NBC_01497]|uniref:trypsin-like serine peptidase n=1 Tax=Streptomyces sp. NBC_01497 TaxID=2903885 RepID=UPI002E36F119|nr:trypsin-like peptidase domain-containing protein [Streptomyces sp. NBC_01497]
MNARLRVGGLAAVLVAAASLACASPAIAVTPAPAAGAAATRVSGHDQRAAAGFWTAARLRAAKDVTAAPVAGRSAPAAAGATAGGTRVLVPPQAAPAVVSRAAHTTPAAPASVAAPASAPTAWTGGGLISTTAGKVFFQNASGGTFACSATVANSDNKSIVLTAGHCVVDAATGEVYHNWVFIPGYANGNRPYGTFTASALFHRDEYVSTGGNANYDFAFAKVSPLGGRTLVDTVGAQGIVFNPATGQDVHSFGYGGSAAEGGGERLNHCEGTEAPDTGRAGSTMWGIDCVQTGGSSGGGFLSGFDTSTGGGYLVGNISVSAGSNEYHPYLGNEALSLYQQAGS